VIIYDDNLSCRSLSQAKKKIYLFSFISFLKERSMVKRGCSLSGLGAFKQHFLNEIYPEQFAVRLYEAFWDPSFTFLSLILPLQGCFVVVIPSFHLHF
jgi:hypothetical protein